MRREKLFFDIKTDILDDEDAMKTAAIRERLRLKYVVNGEWAAMDDDDRQDAALLVGNFRLGFFLTGDNDIILREVGPRGDFYKTFA